MSKSGGVFQIDDVTRTMSKGGGGGAPGVPPIQVQTPPPTPTWLAGYGPDDVCILMGCPLISRDDDEDWASDVGLPQSVGRTRIKASHIANYSQAPVN